MDDYARGQEMWASQANEDKAYLLDELDQLEADSAARELKAMDLSP